LGLGLASRFPIFLQPILKSRNAQFVLLAKLCLRLLALSPRLNHRENILPVVLLIFFHVPKLLAQIFLGKTGLVEWIPTKGISFRLLTVLLNLLSLKILLLYKAKSPGLPGFLFILDNLDLIPKLYIPILVTNKSKEGK
jgi:hypothetical protein